MTKEKMLFIADRNVKKANKAFMHNYDRPGVTEEERENLKDNMEYTMHVRELVRKFWEERE